MRRLFWVLKLIFWVGLIGFFTFNPGTIEIDWMNYHLQTSVFFVVICFVLVEKGMSVFEKMIRYVFHDMGRDIALSHYKSEVKDLKEQEEKRQKKEQEKQAKEKEKRRQLRQKKWQDLKTRLKKRFHFS